MGQAHLRELKRALAGSLILPDDTGYEEARRVWNGMIDRHPAAIAFCTGTQDVVEALAFARAHGTRLAVRAGGHNLAGNSVCDGGLVVDLSRLKAVSVDPARRVARVGAGLLLGELDAATQAFGLATTMGVNSDTGVAGLTLGGGFGRLARKHGLACDNLLSAEVVTADGRRIHAGPADHADLFWGLRGGGGNFGIVTTFELALHPLGPEVLRASFRFAAAEARGALLAYAEVCRAAPDEVSADAGLAIGPSGEAVFGVSACYMGSLEEAARVFEDLLRPLREAGPRASEAAPIGYLALQSAADAVFPRGRRYYWKAQFLDAIGEGLTESLLGAFAPAPSSRSLFVFQQVGGAIARTAPEATAYPNRRAAFDAFPIAIWERREDDEANIAWARTLWEAVQPFSTGAVYVNNLGEEGAQRVRAAYGPAYPRLSALKARYDPGNLFRGNQNIEPAPPR
jgi:FAD/FMN-containing dehydrogenase